MGSAGEISAQVLRARRTAAMARAVMAICGIAASALSPELAGSRTLALLGFAVILLTAVVQLLLPSATWLKVEESLALPAVFIIGFGDQRVDILSLLWLAAVACGVLARGGRVHWIGRSVVLCSLALPIVLHGRVTLEYAALCAATIALLLTCGRVTQELRGLLTRARYEADHDGLTGALSRAAFRDKLDEIVPSVGAGDGAALLTFDLDNFGQVNKVHGHATGDALLSRVVAQIVARVGPEDAVGRMGGDEFAVIVRDQDVNELTAGLICELEQPNDGMPAITPSIGAARIPDDGEDSEALLRAADVALRVAKQGGRQQVTFYVGESLSDHGPDGARATLERLIAGEGLSIVVQPIVDIDTGRPHAFEALARFPAGGPLHWLALADELGLRAELELTCLGAALELLGQRPAGTRLNINLSASLLLDHRTAALLARNAPLAGLVLELTENSLVDDSAELHAAIADLQAAGVDFAVDDMGVGYSGLRQITTVHVSYLKLDRSLITGIDASPGRCALVAALLGYTRQTGGLLVAEGIETAAELATLRGLGVPLAQGFYLGRPAPPWPLSSADATVLAAPRHPALSAVSSTA